MLSCNISYYPIKRQSQRSLIKVIDHSLYSHFSLFNIRKVFTTRQNINGRLMKSTSLKKEGLRIDKKSDTN